ncbi:hypothetical protein Ahy_A04g019543 isoform A [Arachis hypogaea]|uniref:Wbp11/ELF5/Saf1 N-terminal domain-containing protein n=1 Tax=Arachis hypogaea TaxID=3818 RepID=A0A445DG68_ARAHY|nr:hypothetical protein Ahy_A04g019543 isoform A [Arachis hypogaea]
MMIDIGNKKERKKVREVEILKKDPEQLKKQIENLEMMIKTFTKGLEFFKIVADLALKVKVKNITR